MSDSQPIFLAVTDPASVVIRPAEDGDIPGLVALVNEYARRGDLLPRSPQSIADSLRNWFVAVVDDDIIGCVSLLRYTSGLVEVRSLAVADRAHGLGVGTRLMDALIAEAERRGVPTLFALTRAVRFFERNGFTITVKEIFPEKVWTDCQKCPLLHNCDETAVVRHLNPAPPAEPKELQP